MSRPAAVREFLAGTLVWDSHGCIPLRPGELEFLPQLRRYITAGVRVVGLNVGFDAVPWQQTLQMLAHFRHWIRATGSPYRIVESTADLDSLVADRPELGIYFDIEGGSALNEQLSMVELYRDLGVRWMLIAFNRNNALGGGCQDTDPGLTKFGKAVIAEMERVGMTVCCSHTGLRTTMDVMRHATKPVIFSHSNPTGMWRHKRNITDEAIKACARSGGVVGISGIGLLLGKNDVRPQTVADHIDYVAQLVGVDHAGLGLDYAFDQKEVDDFVRDHPEIFSPEEGYEQGILHMEPEGIPHVAQTLRSRGYTLTDLRKVLGENFLRVAHATWPKTLGPHTNGFSL